ncbi:A disintegrin and metalloproteinase with thrombospondin motifs 12-like isoform X2 [Gigantopelta aegis]|uniref:A disintegrin and metalloproteinase with thrombospondin motifs 12-like isoform X2 n=1 Tax=Gigantopelta aegis TaxID=1735272 RepID=UPI001B888FFB|nr:A disintegrin and metalloproteinase with thrombospondin motifs 12-like isoform X2 [Gigantopelta aegis]
MRRLVSVAGRNPPVQCLVLWITLMHLIPAGAEFVFPNRRQAEFAQTLDSYFVSVPSAVDSGGQFLTHELHPLHHHHLHRRSVNSVRGLPPDNTDTRADGRVIHYHIPVEGKVLLVTLERNGKLVAPAGVVERIGNTYKNVSDSVFTAIKWRDCHYTGSVHGDTHSMIALAVCDGLMGFVHAHDEDYFIEPVKGHNRANDSRHPHIIYKRSALPAKLDISRVHKSTDDHTKSCGVPDDTESIFTNRERWERHNNHVQKKHRRRKRSISVEKHVETLVVVEPQMVEYYKNEDIENYVLTVMNMVAALFHDAMIGNAVNIVVVRIIMLEESQEDLKITHHADKTLQSFCKWQKKMNFRDDDDPNHHDVAVLLTRHNICSRMNKPCSTLGLAQVAGMCQPHRTCNINEDTGLALAFTITHELGHNFGMKHDSVHNSCESPPGVQYVMSPHLIADGTVMSWSKCSRESITKFLDRDWGYCLDDEPGRHDFNLPTQPPGIMYDTGHQCRLQYGEDAALCEGIEVIENVCNTLWCRVDNKCSTKLQAAAEGTICGTNKWCYGGRCVEIGNRPQAINGQWGRWAGWTECTRECGAGVSYSQRHCDNPPPSHGGKYCIGERKRYRICNTDVCPEGVPSFRHKQCSDFNYVPYKNRLHEWEPILTPHTPCQLHCKPRDRFFSAMLKDMVTDGTPCTPGSRNMCISGRCRHVGCDWLIDSSAVEDRCGVCYGDGSTCKTVKNQFNETEKLGYVEATVIPKGARNIRVEEVAAANNFLALRNNKGEYYLNGHWFIQWSGDYEVAGTVVRYQREGSKESFNAPGPLKEALHIMLLVQTHNPGIVFEYTVPKENATDNRIPEFRWDYSDWSHCTVSCGGGTQRSQVVCLEKEAGIVDEMYCNASSKPDDRLRGCNEHRCPARWWTGPWQHCSVTCGNNGIHRRTVICVRSLGPDEQIALENEVCKGLDKPTEVEPCNHKDPCPGSRHWEVGAWSQCTRSCGGGTRHRTVSCPPSANCYQQTKPATEQHCAVNKCPAVTENTDVDVSTTPLSQTATGGSQNVQTTSSSSSFQSSSSAGEMRKPHGVNSPDGTVNSPAGTVKSTNTVNSPANTVNSPANTVNSPAKNSDMSRASSRTSATEQERKAQTTEVTPSASAHHTLPTQSSAPADSNIHTPGLGKSGHSVIRKIILPSTTTASSDTTSTFGESQNVVRKTKESYIKISDSGIDIEIPNKVLKESGDLSSPRATTHKHQHKHGHSNNVVIGGGKLDNSDKLDSGDFLSVVSPGEDNSNLLINQVVPNMSSVKNRSENSLQKLGNDIVHKDGPKKGDNSRPGDIDKTGQEELQDNNKGPPLAYIWQKTKWTKCSRHCGGGVKTRDVLCVDATSGRMVLSDHCLHAYMPTTSELCHRFPCLQWQTTDWESCSATCGYAVQSRNVFCPSPLKCDLLVKPSNMQQCKLQPCISWVNGDWSRCTQSCGIMFTA